MNETYILMATYSETIGYVTSGKYYKSLKYTNHLPITVICKMNQTQFLSDRIVYI